MTGAVIITYQFFSEYKGKKYTTSHNETDTFNTWKIRRYILIRKGLWIMMIGIGLQVILIIVNYIILNII